MFKKGFYVGKLYITFSVIRRAIAVIVLVFLSIFTTVKIYNNPSNTLKQEILHLDFNNTKDINLQHQEATLIDTYGTSIIRGVTTPQEPKVIDVDPNEDDDKPVNPRRRSSWTDDYEDWDTPIEGGGGGGGGGHVDPGLPQPSYNPAPSFNPDITNPTPYGDDNTDWPMHVIDEPDDPSDKPDSDHGDVYYIVLRYFTGTSNPGITPSTSDTSWTTNYPTIAKTDPAGYYHVWSYIKSTDPAYRDSDPKWLGCVYIKSNPEKILDTPTPPEYLSTSFRADDIIVLTSQATATVGSTIKYALGGENKAPVNGWTDNYQDIKVKNAGTYYVWYFNESSGNAESSQPAKVVPTISRADGDSVTVEGITFKSGLTYDKTAKELIDNAGSAKVSGNSYSDGVIEYAFGNDDTTPPTGGWNTKENIKKTDAGTYYVWARVKADSNVNTGTPVYAGSTVTIANATGEITKDPVAKTKITYSGSDQPLLSSLGTGTGTIKYIVSTDGTKTYSGTVDSESDFTSAVTSLNQITGKDAGDYYVYYGASAAGKNYDASTIKKLGPIHIYQKVIPNVQGPTAVTLYYNDNEQSLLKTSGSVANGHLEYKLGDNSATEPDFNSGTILEANYTDVKGKEVKTYYVWYRGVPTYISASIIFSVFF